MNCLYKICQKKTDPKIVKAVFELRMMCECGFMPPAAGMPELRRL